MTVGSTDYIPTVVAYKGETIQIGEVAKKNATKKGYESYEHFKLRLGDDARSVITGKSKSPIEVATDYINILLDEYKENQNIDAIDRVVMTVPETWFREASNRTARENIESIYKKLGYKSRIQFQMESEPVAAAGYFCWSYSNKHKEEKNFDGHILVIDYGGGTLDVTLCKVEQGTQIKVLERCGYGEYNESNGCAGVAFDENVIENISEKNELNLKRGEKKFAKLCSSFETEKITETRRVSEMMQLYYNNPDIVEGEEVFTLEFDEDEIPVFCQELAESFDEVNRKYLEDSIHQIKSFFNVHGVDSSDQNRFRILMVGGFSNFYSVEDTVRKEFESRTGLVDKRFEQEFSINNRSLAIAKGAALIARDEIAVEHTCTHNIGYIVVRQGKDDYWEDKDVTIIEKGMKISEAINPLFAPNRIRVRLKNGALRIFLDDGREDGQGRMQAALDQSVGELFPNVSEPDNEYQIGFSVDDNLIPTLHIKDKRGEVNNVYLNSLLAKLAIREIE